MRERLLAIYEKTMDSIACIILLALLLIVWAQIGSRYILNDSLTWTEEAARYLMIWGVLLGSGIALLRGYLISINLFLQKMPSHLRRVLFAVNRLLSLFFFGLLTYYGVKLCVMGSRMESPALGIPYTWIYLSIPVGSLLLFLLFLAVPRR